MRRPRYLRSSSSHASRKDPHSPCSAKAPQWMPLEQLEPRLLLSTTLSGQLNDGMGYVPNELVVQFVDGVDPVSLLDSAGIAYGSMDLAFGNAHSLLQAGSGMAAQALGNTYKIDLGADNDSLAGLLGALSGLEGVVYAEPNHVYTFQWVPDDPYWSSSDSWGQVYDDLWALKDNMLNMDDAWDEATGDGIVVAVIDSGVDRTHEDLSANMWVNTGETPGNSIDDDGNGYVDDYYGWDFWYNDNDPDDGLGHGTHVAGTIAAEGDNDKGIIGVAPDATIMAVKVGHDTLGKVDILGAAEGVVYAVDNGADVLNNSWGGSPLSYTLQTAFDYAYEHGVVAVAAAGNVDRDVDFMAIWPVSFDNVISVAATTETDQKASFSNYGELIDVSAPGGALDGRSNILSTMPDDSVIATGYPGLEVEAGYWRLGGTSMAAPHVAGVAALILEEFPTATPDEVRGRIRAAVDDIYPRLVNFSDYTISSYGTADEGTATILDNGLTLKLEGDASKKIDISDYTITADTIIEFDFRSTSEGDVHGIGFDDDNTVTSTQVFQLHGTDTYGIQDHNDYSGTGWTHYKIKVGAEYTGTQDFLTLLSTEDGGSPDAVSYFRSIEIYDAFEINFNDFSISSYGTGDNGTATIEDDGATLKLEGDAWKKIDISDYTITANTVIEFDYKRTGDSSDVQGIGFDDDNTVTSTQVFQLDGNDTYGVQDYNDYVGVGSWVHYKIKVGNHYTGSQDYLTLLSTDDTQSANTDTYFRNLTIYETDTGPQNVGYAGLLGTGRVDAYGSLTATEGDPDLLLWSAEGELQSDGSSHNISVQIKNLWGDATNAGATLTTEHDDVTITDGSWTIGSIDGGDMLDNSYDPFVVTIDPSLTDGNVVDFTVKITADGNFEKSMDFTVSLAWLKKVPGYEMGDLPFFTIEVADRSGVADINGDGTPEIFVVCQDTLLLHQLQYSPYHLGGSKVWTEISTDAGLWGLGDVDAATFLDYDNDGDLDLFGGSVKSENERAFLYSNNGDGTFTDVSTASGITALGTALGTWTCTVFDYNNDGYADIYGGGKNSSGSTTYLLKNGGDGTFTNVLNDSEIPVQDHYQGWSDALDYDDDGDTDLLLGLYDTTTTEVQLWENDIVYGTFTDVTSAAGLSDPDLTYDTAIGDYDNDGDLDIYFGKRGLYRNNGGEPVTFTDVTTTAGLGSLSDSESSYGGTMFVDIDNDGYLDLYVTEGNPTADYNRAFLNNGDGTFTEVTAKVYPYDGTSFSVRPREAPAVATDFNGDGTMDLYTPTEHFNMGTGIGAMLDNKIGAFNNWLKVQLKGIDSPASGLGAKIFVTASGETMMREVHGREVDRDAIHFGLGDATVVTKIEVEWSSGTTQTIESVGINQTVLIREDVDNPNLVPSPTAQWTFDGDPDDAIGSNDGTTSGSPTFLSHDGQAIVLDGSSDYVSMGDVLDPGTGNYTVSLWFRRDGTGFEYMAAKGYGAVEGWSIYAGVADHINCLVFDGQNVAYVQGPLVTDTDWHHVAMVLDRSADQLVGYLDGSSAGWNTDGDDITGFDIDGTADLYLGRSTYGIGLFEGALDDVRVYDAALSSTDVDNLSDGEDITDDMVAHWKLDNNAADSFGDYEGTINGTPEFKHQLEFDGTNDYVDFGDILDPGMDSYTVSAWFKLDDAEPDFPSYIIAKDIPYDSDNGWAMQARVMSGYSGFQIQMVVTDGQDNWANLRSPSITDTNWHFVAMVIDWDSDQLIGYVDDSNSVDDAEEWLITNGDLTGVGSITSSESLTIGAAMYNSTAYGFLDGQVDDARIYETALSAAQVEDLYSLAAHWRLDGDATHSAGSNNGTVQGDPNYVSGPLDRAIDLDGTTDYLTMGDVLDPGTGDYTVSLWFQRDGTGQEYLAGKRSSGVPSGWSIHFTSSNALSLTAGDGDDVANITGPTVTDTDWHHLALVIDQTNDKIIGYLDGSNSGWDSDSLSGVDSISSANDLVFGARDDGTTISEYFDGAMDEARIYTRALDAAEIVDLVRQTDAYVNFNDYTITSYGAGDDGTATIEDAGMTLKLEGDAWKKINFEYNVTDLTIVEFDFKSTTEGDVHGLGFDDDNTVTSTQVFQVHGTDTYGIQDHNDYSGTGWVHYKIHVGYEYTGTQDFLTLLNTDDGVTPDAVSYFRYVTVYDADDTLINFNDYTISSYGTEDDGTAVIMDGGMTLLLFGDAYKKIDFEYEITANTVIEFDFKVGGDECDVYGIGFDDDNTVTSSQVFQLHGTDTTGWNQDYNNYTSGWVHYTITVGDEYTGQQNFLTLLNAEDSMGYPEEYYWCLFRYLRIYESA